VPDNLQIAIYSCDDFYQLRVRYPEGVSVPWSDGGFSSFQVCVEADLINRAKSPDKTKFEKGSFLRDLCENLDLTSFPSSLSNRIDEGFVTPCSFFGEKVEFVDNAIEVDDEGWTYSFKIIAFGDFDGSGEESALVEFRDMASRSSYRIVSPMIVAKDPTTGRMSAKSVYQR
jgi:hypothetical protein